MAGLRYVAQVGLKVVAVLSPLPLSARVLGVCQQARLRRGC